MVKRIAVCIHLFAFAFTALIAAEESSPSAFESEPPEVESSDYVINPSDLLRFQVYQEEELTREVRVSQNGNISLPLIGSVEVKGKTVDEAERLLAELYDRDYLVNPQVNLGVLEYSQRRVNVLGQVNRPGTVVFPPEESMTLIDAISRAGGFQRNANRRSVILSRTNEDGEVKRYNVNTEEIIQGNTSFIWQLERDDVIYVPQRIF